MLNSDAYVAALDESSTASGVSWAAVFAGAVAAAALSLILLLLGSGLGFAAVSPWADKGLSAQGLGISAIIWLAFTQLIAAAMGGYLAGRLRKRWTTLHNDEVYFRDTAHGFLAWGVATLVTASLLVGSVSSLVSGTAQVSATLATSPATAQVAESNNDTYFIDSLFRDSRAAPVTSDAAHDVAARIVARNLASDSGALNTQDRAYLAQLVAQRTDLSQADAEARVDKIYGEAHQAVVDLKVAADAAKKAAAHATLWMFVALLIGAFVAAFTAIYGGRQRDAVVIVEDRRTVPVR
ncbi:hypothetical protein ACVW0Y_002474 [Pseudomonas sp. TE3786]